MVEKSSGDSMNIVQIEPIGHHLWDSLVAATDSSVFHSSGWLRVLDETYGMPVCAYVLLNEAEQPIAGVPYCLVQDLKGRRLVSIPFSDFCDPLATDPAQWNGLLEALLEGGSPLFMRCVHSELPLSDPRLECYNRAKWHGLDLCPELEALWQGLHGSARQAVRRAQQNHVEVCAAQSKQELRTFYEMHLEVRKHKYHLLAQPYRFFERIWEHFVEAEQGVLLLARQGNEIVGGTFFLKWKDRFFYKFNASLLDNLSSRPNDLLIWEGIRCAKALGCTYLDFGLSDWDQEGLIRYKRKFTTEEKTISFLRSFSCEKPTEQEQQIRTLLPQLTALLTDGTVSNAITERAGEVLYRFFV
jgi:CelD/BcsL family acetyltransferase involved in cellulose biosynthesis